MNEQALEAAANALRDIKFRRPTFDEQAQAAITAITAYHAVHGMEGEHGELLDMLRTAVDCFGATKLATEAADAIEALTAERDKLLLRLDTLCETYMKYKRRAATAEQERDALQEQVAGLEKAFSKIRRTPSKPFPDPGAHSQAAFNRSVFTAWSDIQRIARAALDSSND